MPLLIPFLLVGGFSGLSGFIVGGSLSDKLGSALRIAGLVTGLFMVYALAKKFGFIGG